MQIKTAFVFHHIRQTLYNKKLSLKCRIKQRKRFAGYWTLSMIVLCNNETACPMLNNESERTRVRRKERIIAAMAVGTLKKHSQFILHKL